MPCIVVSSYIIPQLFSLKHYNEVLCAFQKITFPSTEIFSPKKFSRKEHFSTKVKRKLSLNSLVKQNKNVGYLSPRLPLKRLMKTIHKLLNFTNAQIFWRTTILVINNLI